MHPFFMLVSLKELAMGIIVLREGFWYCYTKVILLMVRYMLNRI